jgi:hypothetical protein
MDTSDVTPQTKHNAPGFLLYLDRLTTLEILNDEQAGRVFKALVKYAATREICELDQSEKIVFETNRISIAESASNYAEIRRVNSGNGKKGAQARWTQNKKTDSDRHF